MRPKLERIEELENTYKEIPFSPKRFDSEPGLRVPDHSRPLPYGPLAEQ